MTGLDRATPGGTNSRRTAPSWDADGIRLAAVVTVSAAALATSYAIAGSIGAILFIAGGVGLMVAIRFPGILLAAYLLLPFYKGAAQPYVPVDITAILAALCLFQVIPVAREGRLMAASKPAVVLWMLVAMTVLVGVIYSPDPQVALVRAITFIGLVSLPLLITGLRVASHEQHLRHFVWAFLLMSIITVAIGLTTTADESRLAVLGANTIQTARAALILPLILIVLMPGTTNPLIRMIAVVLGVAAILVALASGSRGPIVALLIMGGFGALRMFARPRIFDARYVLVAVVLVASSALIVATGAIDLPESATVRFSEFGDFITRTLSGDVASADVSAVTRVRLFSAAAEMMEANPLIGAGTAAYEAQSAAYLWPVQGFVYPHNAILQLGAEHGVVGVLLFVALTYLALTRSIPVGSYGHVIRVLFVFLLINAMFSGNIDEDRQVWGLMLLLALIDVPEREVKPAASMPWRASYLVPTPNPWPYWAQNLRVAGWQRTYRVDAPAAREPGPYTLPPRSDK